MQRDHIDFRDTAVRKLFLQFLLPTVLGMVSSAVFIITDGIFVGKGIGSDALAGVNIVAPLYMLATGLGLMFGMGGSVVASVNLARGKKRVADINITQSVVVPGIVIALISIAVVLLCDPILVLLGTPADLHAPAGEYLRWFMPFMSPLALFTILMFVVRLDGSPKFAMACNMGAAGINIVLDYLFIFVFGWGLAGAAVATGIGYTLGACAMIWYMQRHNRTLNFVRLKTSLTSLRLTVRNIGYMAYVGFPALLSEIAIASMMIVGNYTFVHYIGKDGVAAYSIACYIFPIIFMVYNGIIQSAQPIISYNYGAGAPERGRQALQLALRTAVICGSIITAFTWVASEGLAGMFLTPDAPAHTLAVTGLPLFALGYAFFGINVVTIGYYQSIERSRLATGLTLLRGIVLMCLCFVVLPRWWGVTGIWLAVPAAELLVTLLLAGLLLRSRSRS